MKNKNNSISSSRIDILEKSVRILGGILIAINFATISRFDASNNTLPLNKSGEPVDFVDSILKTTTRVAIADSMRATFGAGGENIWDILLYTINFWSEILAFYGGAQRKARFLTEEKAKKNGLWDKEDFKIKNKDGDQETDEFIDENTGLKVKTYKFYVESNREYNAKRGVRIATGIGLVSLALYFNTVLSSSKFANAQIPWIQQTPFGQGMVGAAFSFTFVFGMLLFATAMRGIINEQMKKLDEPSTSKWKKNLLNISLFIATAGLSAGLAGLATKIQTSIEIDGVTKVLWANLTLQSFITSLCILVGIAILGRILLENVLKKDVIKFFARYNSLMGENGVEDAFTNDAINEGYKVSYIVNEKGENVYVKIPEGRKLEAHNVFKLESIEDSKIAEYAVDKDGNYYLTIDDQGIFSKISNKKKQKAELIIYSVMFYASTMICYGIVYLIGKFGMPLINKLVNNDIAAAMIQNVINDSFYLIAILCGIQAINILMKIAHMHIFNIKFEKEIQGMIDEDLIARKNSNNWKRLASLTMSLVCLGVSLYLVYLFTQRKISFELGLSFIVLAIMLIFNVFNTISAKFAEQNKQIDLELKKMKTVDKLSNVIQENKPIKFITDQGEKQFVIVGVDTDQNINTLTNKIKEELKDKKNIDFNLVIRNANDDKDKIYHVRDSDTNENEIEISELTNTKPELNAEINEKINNKEIKVYKLDYEKFTNNKQPKIEPSNELGAHQHDNPSGSARSISGSNLSQFN
jgi:5S rRNA maturation endonuclease (ribonuclease M5)